MRLARLSLAALALVAFAACSTDATLPEASSGQNGRSDTPREVPADPSLTGGTIGSGMKEMGDSTYRIFVSVHEGLVSNDGEGPPSL